MDIADEQAKSHAANRIDSIELEIGSLAGVEMDALLFAWDVAVPGTVLDKTEQIIHQVPAIARGMDCGNRFETRQLFESCPSCRLLWSVFK